MEEAMAIQNAVDDYKEGVPGGDLLRKGLVYVHSTDAGDTMEYYGRRLSIYMSIGSITENQFMYQSGSRCRPRVATR